MFLRDQPELARRIPREKANKPDAKPRASTPRVASVGDSYTTSQGQEPSQMVSQLFPTLASPSFLASNLSAMVSDSQVPTTHPASVDTTGNVDFLSSMLFPPNNTDVISSLCTSRIGQELLSLLSRPAQQLPNHVPSNVSRLPIGLLQNSGLETTALLELLLRSEGTGTGTNMNGMSVTSAAAEHYRNLLHASWPPNNHQQPEDRR